MPGLREIAEAAGVSIRTAGRALKDNGYVRAETRQAVQAAAKRLRYRPNRYARGLKTSRSYEVTVVAWSYDELHMAKIAGLEHALRTADYSVNVLFEFPPDSSAFFDSFFDSFYEEVLDRPSAGVVIFGSGPIPVSVWAERLAGADVPYVFLDEKSSVLDAIRIDRQQGVYEAVRYLARQGRRRIAYLGLMEETRLVGYHRALRELDRQPIHLDLTGSANLHAAARQCGRELAGLPSRPDAVQAYSDKVAMAFLAGVHEAGLRVPNDLAVVGFDDRATAALTYPPLTTVAQPNWDVGVAAAEMLLKKIDGEKAPVVGWSRTLPTQLVVRESA